MYYLYVFICVWWWIHLCVLYVKVDKYCVHLCVCVCVCVCTRACVSPMCV